MNVRYTGRSDGITAFCGDQYVGHITVLVDNDVHANRVGFIYVEPEYRRRGIAIGLYYAAALASGKLNKVLLSDNFLNEKSAGVWKKLLESFPQEVKQNDEGRFFLDLRDHAPQITILFSGSAKDNT